MQKMKICLLAMFVVLFLGMAGCGNDREESGVVAPIQMQVSTEHLHPRMGLSGFILGTFMLLNAYVIILMSCAALIIKEQTFKKAADTLRMGLQMLNPNQSGEGMCLKLLSLLSNGETRFKAGTAGLICGLLLAYIGAWIAV
ncbi:MAG: hypothetical protein ACOX3E_00880 [Desulfomonilia bacterium]|uniref:Uncharacterized protein n=1 Tax=anaerobic digester metagenome TaxID=1263854 RepID=A0A485M765_9ZZZZ|nr:hypothetical protein [Pseudomonadota bacterium]HON37973.1 hypothetical protein [Deltaproteobacteria bacterium]HRS56718.1 hypothetical protein [Desulfomonilia bacterium]HPD21290.1 hypothetical protein [Deltaproteobacteria bacterium]HPX19109.1 hypothetical protein [Deltaproteobacteria bacterium]